MIYKYILSLSLLLSCSGLFAQKTDIKYLSGTDKDHTVSWDFYCTDGRKSGKWTQIAVPSNWEQQGFGSYNYGHDRPKHDEKGLYTHSFSLDKWKGKRVYLVFEGSMTDTKVKVNGRSAGPEHQGGFYEFSYDITDLLKQKGKNLLEVEVSKMSSNPSINDAERQSDYWVFGGIFRPVYLKIVPETHIERLAINAKADGTFAADIFLNKAKDQYELEAQVYDAKGEKLGAEFSVKVSDNQMVAQLNNSFNKPRLWSAEFPNLYFVKVSLKKGDKTIHQIEERFGFRTMEVRPHDGLYLNGKRIVLKGSNRHSFWPETGRTLSHDLHVMDAGLIKEMNMNAVRMSHYPPDKDFLHVCDSIGLYVIDELAGWQSKYDTEMARRLVKELIVRDVNHSSILFWANGNEGGWNRDVDGDYKLYDPQNRNVIHPWEYHDGINTKHYPDYNYVVRETAEGQEVFMPTEFMHGLYDGGAGASLKDFWRVMKRHPYLGGGFIWAFVDESVMRTDRDNALDSDGNHAADGILGPHREKEGSFFAIKELWSPIQIISDNSILTSDFDGKLRIANDYSFTSLSQCSLKWQLVRFPSVSDQSTKNLILAQGQPKPLELMPGEHGILDLNLPADWAASDALYLTAYDINGREIFTWSWSVKAPKAFVPASTGAASSTITVSDNEKILIVKDQGIDLQFDKSTGFLSQIEKGSKKISLSGGPSLAGVNTKLTSFKYSQENEGYTVQAEYDGDATLKVKWTFTPGQPVKMEYTYKQQGEADFMGITFDYPEDKISGMKWLGRGPYRVWKNRMQGLQFGVWEKEYNNSITGETTEYPEFKGFHAEVNWVQIQNKELPFTVYTEDEHMYFQMLQPSREQDALQSNNVEPAFPKGSFGFLQGISAIGTKFQSATVMGPEGQKYRNKDQWVSGTLWFNF
ncbi:glycoside hydrolase family 2 TIM barrel-domain containing protein [Fulvivirga ligni]|uniref:glycoside hydrolase family 2 TIM barrel-domain containing protein n=1 Tax=Fulvivirga ligni TaxID=2904246 RepID=UPI001F3738A9|nr:glycoside hydrolase family 2 TIM barrel-domain containing protein [Fulvivirga ligni]UII18960.1 glycoside hydrolase family 2 [Fulvivirga ligni]